MNGLLHDILELGALWTMPVVTVGGFWFLYRQMKADRESLETQTSWQICSVSSAVLQTFMDHPECRKYFYDNIPLPADERERSTVLTAVELLCDHLENTFVHQASIDQKTKDVWQHYVQKMYARSAVMRQFLGDDQEGYRYDPGFVQMARALHASGNSLSP